MPHVPTVLSTLLALAVLGAGSGVPAAARAGAPGRPVAADPLIAPPVPRSPRAVQMVEPPERPGALTFARHGWTGFLGNVEGSVRAAIERARPAGAVLRSPPVAESPARGSASPEDGGGPASAIPRRLWLGPVVPNPSTGRTTLRFDLPKAGRVRVAVVDVAGRIVRDTRFPKAAGRHVLALDLPGGHAAPGVYFVIMDVDGRRVGTRRLVLRY